MKQTIVLLAATAMTAFFAAQAQAAYQAVGSDGIAASPKVRLMLNQQEQSATATQAATKASCCQASAAKMKTASAKCCGSCCDKMAKQAQPAPTK